MQIKYIGNRTIHSKGYIFNKDTSLVEVTASDRDYLFKLFPNEFEEVKAKVETKEAISEDKKETTKRKSTKTKIEEK